MSGLEEIAVTVVRFFVEVSIYLVQLVVAPLRFVFSRRYRAVVRERWQGHPRRCVGEVFGGTVALLLFVGWLSWVIFLFTRHEAPSRYRSAEELERRLLEKVRDFRKRHE